MPPRPDCANFGQGLTLFGPLLLDGEVTREATQAIFQG